jgi:multidrug efflux pump subunit AcrB
MQVRAIAEQLAQVLRASPDTLLANFDWDEKNRIIRLAINQAKVRQSGLSSAGGRRLGSGLAYELDSEPIIAPA